MTLTEFLILLDDHRVPYRLERDRDAVMVCVAVPGERWEIEFMDGGGVEVEKFRSTEGVIQELTDADIALLLED